MEGIRPDGRPGLSRGSGHVLSLRGFRGDRWANEGSEEAVLFGAELAVGSRSTQERGPWGCPGGLAFLTHTGAGS